MRKSMRFLLVLLMLAPILSGCSYRKEASGLEWRDANVKAPELPDKLETNQEGIPILKVYDVDSGKIEETDIETYVTGVVAGEMKNSWPLEALKAQAILARTFVLKFCDTKESKYEGADISTDVSEAQAYAPQNINERVIRAVGETRGMVMSDEGEFPYAWFFAHAGGVTELPSIALDFSGEDPDYLEVEESPDSPKAPEDVKNWSVTFTEEQVVRACAETGLKVKTVDSIEIGERGESGRAKTLLVNGESVSAPSFRIAIGANQLKSTLIDKIQHEDNNISFAGRGFGHGVGMSQWGAYAMAEEGKNVTEIITHYFDDIDIAYMW